MRSCWIFSRLSGANRPHTIMDAGILPRKTAGDAG
jgi:hypothetical protein